MYIQKMERTFNESLKSRMTDMGIQIDAHSGEDKVSSLPMEEIISSLKTEIRESNKSLRNAISSVCLQFSKILVVTGTTKDVTIRRQFLGEMKQNVHQGMPTTFTQPEVAASKTGSEVGAEELGL